MAQREEVIRKTVYVSDIYHQVTEEQLVALFVGCGRVVDCRICGDPNSVLYFAFIEFTDDEVAAEGARNALNLAWTTLGYYPVRVLPSKTAIAPVNPTFLPRSEDEREMCARTVYCTNIGKKVTQADVKLFFESICGEVQRLRLLGDYHHSTCIAFVEFVMIVTKQSWSLTLNLHNKNEQDGLRNLGTLTVHAEETVASRNAIEITFRCSNLENKDLFSKRDPFLRISRIVETGGSVPICKTEVVNNNLNPIWKPLSLTMQHFGSK